MMCFWSVPEISVTVRLEKKSTKATSAPPRFHLSNPPTNKRTGDTLVLVEAITFECQKIILAVIFSHISAAAKAKNGRGAS